MFPPRPATRPRWLLQCVTPRPARGERRLGVENHPPAIGDPWPPDGRVRPSGEGPLSPPAPCGWAALGSFRPKKTLTAWGQPRKSHSVTPPAANPNRGRFFGGASKKE
jgi:hypothetical protein